MMDGSPIPIVLWISHFAFSRLNSHHFLNSVPNLFICYGIQMTGYLYKNSSRPKMTTTSLSTHAQLSNVSHYPSLNPNTSQTHLKPLRHMSQIQLMNPQTPSPVAQTKDMSCLPPRHSSSVQPSDPSPRSSLIPPFAIACTTWIPWAEDSRAGD